MDDAAQRLRQAREGAGYDTATAAAEAFGWKQVTYLAHEGGRRGLRQDAAERYAKAFRVSPEWLMTGRKTTTERLVPVVGYVGAGDEVIPFDDHAHGDGIDRVTVPLTSLGPQAVGVRVRGASMLPRFREHEILVYDDHAADPVALFGRECVVRLADGRIFVKILQPGSGPGLYTLLSLSAAPIRDVAIEWVAKIKCIIPAD